MKRLLLLMLSLLLVLALVGCGKAKEEPDADAADANVLTNGEQLPITEAGALEYDNSSVTCRFRKDEDGWKWVDNETFPLDAAYVEEILTALDTMSAALTPLDPTVDPAECGLDEPNRYMTVTVGEEVTTLRFGDQKDDGTWYMSIDGQEGVYLVEDAFVTLMDRSIYDMAALPVLPVITEENLLSAAVQGGENVLVNIRVVDGVRKVGSRDVTEATAALVEELGRLSVTACVDYDPAEGAAAICGLDAPDAQALVTYTNELGTESTLTLTVGLPDGSGGRYVTVNDDPTIYRMEETSLVQLLTLAETGLN